MSEQQYLPLENGEGSSEFSPQLEKEQIYTRRDTLYRNAFFYILTVYAVLLVLWIFLSWKTERIRKVLRHQMPYLKVVSQTFSFLGFCKF